MNETSAQRNEFYPMRKELVAEMTETLAPYRSRFWLEYSWNNNKIS